MAAEAEATSAVAEAEEALLNELESRLAAAAVNASMTATAEEAASRDLATAEERRLSCAAFDSTDSGSENNRSDSSQGSRSATPGHGSKRAPGQATPSSQRLQDVFVAAAEMRVADAASHLQVKMLCAWQSACIHAVCLSI